jgi:hypothetical protein
VPEFIVGTFPLSATVAQSLYRYIQTDLVAIFEAIRYGLGWVVYTDRHSIYGMLFHAGLKGVRGEADKPEPRVVDPRSPRLAPDGKPDLKWRLGSQAVVSEGRQQAHDAMRNPLACLCQRVVLGYVDIGQDIQSSPHALEEATLAQATEVDTRDTVRVEVAGT